MRKRNSLRSVSKNATDGYIVRRGKRVYFISKTNRRTKTRQG